MVEFIKICDQYPCKFNFDHIFSSIILLLSANEKQIFKILCLGKMGNFLLPGVVMTKTWGRVLLGAQIQFFD